MSTHNCVKELRGALLTSNNKLANLQIQVTDLKQVLKDQDREVNHRCCVSGVFAALPSILGTCYGNMGSCGIHRGNAPAANLGMPRETAGFLCSMCVHSDTTVTFMSLAIV